MNEIFFLFDLDCEINIKVAKLVQKVEVLEQKKAELIW